MRKMKDSGIEWIGEIPEEWEVRRGKAILNLRKQSPLITDDVITCFRDGQVTLRKNRREDGFTFSDKEIGYQHIQKGDIVVHGMDGFAGAMGISDSDGKGSPVLIVCQSNQNDSFLIYYLRMLATQNVFLALATGIRERSCDLRWNKIAELLFPLPSLPEQQRIADYLDSKCDSINSTIEKQTQIIEKLQEYKRSLITQVVTKGLNPKAKMKDSGIDWLGEIPEGWEVRRLKWITKVVRGGSPRPIEDYLTDDSNGLNWIKIGDTVKGSKYIDHVAQKILPTGLNKTRQVHAGDLLLTNSMSFGEAYILNVDGCIHDGWVCLQDLKNIHKVFLYYFLTSSFAITQFSLQVAGGVVQNLNVDKIGSIFCLLPPLPEQQQIADYLDDKCSRIDAVIAKKQALIEKLTEYKKSLIYEVVTGKREI